MARNKGLYYERINFFECLLHNTKATVRRRTTDDKHQGQKLKQTAPKQLVLYQEPRALATAFTTILNAKVTIARIARFQSNCRIPQAEQL